MDVMEVVDKLLEPERIIYADIATREKRKTRKRKES